ncbi:hypothetical protein L208DRAFT_1518733 [Tricholoma matsutake]|nr:hypothetical protein L208DRAFT_1518733 [Tricholoma matsutake 945]
MYSKMGGKNGKHTWVPSATHITSVSYLLMQVYEHMHNRQFRAVPRVLQHLHVKRFTLLPSSLFLCTLNSIPNNTAGEQYIELSPTDYTHFVELHVRTQHIVLTLKLQKGRKAITLEMEEEED